MGGLGGPIDLTFDIGKEGSITLRLGEESRADQDFEAGRKR